MVQYMQTNKTQSSNAPMTKHLKNRHFKILCMKAVVLKNRSKPENDLEFTVPEFTILRLLLVQAAQRQCVMRAFNLARGK